jgi:2,3-bisphosphoglycerate-independent phosphoglycerate mutase
MKILFMILDGLGDRPIKELGNKTPLEAAETPNFDFLVEKGICGLVEPVYHGDFPTSKDAHMSLFGYDLDKYCMKRGVFEVLGIGMEMKQGDIALRGDLASVDENMIIVDRRSGRIKDSKPFIKKIQNIKIDGISFLVKASVNYRLGVIMRGEGLSENISDNDLHKEGILPQIIKPLDDSKEAKFTANVLNKFLEKTHKILKQDKLNKQRIKQGKLPANYLLVRTAGEIKLTPSFYEKYGLKACCVAGGGLYKGIGKVLGMDLLKLKGATGDFNTDIAEKIKASKNALANKYNFCFLHIKATDNFSHDGDFLGKKEFIEKVDRYITPILSLKDTLVVVTGDHCTPCELKQHSCDSIPILVFGNGEDKVKKFSEKDCKNGKIGKIKSTELMKKLSTCQF